MRCEAYFGVCNPICWGCNGPMALDCIECGVNSYRDFHGACVCNLDFIGDDCSVYNGQCDLKCQGCTGPDITECISC